MNENDIVTINMTLKVAEKLADYLHMACRQYENCKGCPFLDKENDVCEKHGIQEDLFRTTYLERKR